jgi:hypothetical protein
MSKTVPQLGEAAQDFIGPTAQVDVHDIPLDKRQRAGVHLGPALA